jgi:AGZA family xanthine/uracil permease-like MFS transporter
MMRALADIGWDDATDYVPAVVVALAMPFTFSITSGIGLGFVVYVVVKLAAGRVAEVPGAAWLIAALSVAKFALA